jgi:hypothetical protein
VGQDLSIVQPKKVVKLGNPILHVHQLSLRRLKLGEREVLVDYEVEVFEFIGLNSPW